MLQEGLANVYKSRDSHAGSHDPVDPKLYPQVLDVTPMCFVQAKQIMISRNFFFFFLNIDIMKEIMLLQHCSTLCVFMPIYIYL